MHTIVKKSFITILMLVLLLNSVSCFKTIFNEHNKSPSVLIYLNGSERSKKLLKMDKAGIYLKTLWLSAALGMEVFVDEKEKIVVYTNKEQVVYIDNDAVLDKSKDLIWLEGESFIHINTVEMLYDGKIDWNSDKKILNIDSKMFNPGNGTLAKRSRVRNNLLDHGSTHGYFNKNTPVEIIEMKNEWTRIRIGNGIVGWVKAKNISDIHYETQKIIQFSDQRRNELLNPSNKIIMTWQYIYQTTPNPSELYIVKDLDVISPTWFSLKNNDAEIRDKGKIEYVEWAHENSYQVWITSSNSFDPKLTSEILNSTEKRKKVIDELIRLLLFYNADGLSLDWENIYLKDKAVFTQFLRELYPKIYKNNLILSADITTVSTSENWSMCYERDEISSICDFIVLMTYDQYWAGGDTSGSVAELPWVEKGVLELLEFAPPEKIIMGIPFYSRLWKETSTHNGINVESEAYYMEYSLELAKKHDAKWDEKISQYYSEWIIGKTKYRLWVDETNSILEKVKLLDEYDLKGVAFWRKGYEILDIWDQISQEVR